MSWLRACCILVALSLLIAQHGMAQQSTPAESSVSSQEVLAVVNGTELTKMHFDMLIQQYRPEQQQAAQSNKGQVMRQLVMQEILAQEGKRLQLDQAPQFQALLRLQNNNALARSVVSKYVDEKSGVTAEVVRKHYDTNQATYTGEEQITASHILVKTEAEAREALKELKQGKDFAEVAKAKSTGPSGPKGGALGSFSRGRMVPAFEEAAFALKAGEVSEPVQTQFGYHIITVTDRAEMSIKPFEAVQEEIRQSLVSEYINTLLEDLQGKAAIEIKNSDYSFEEQP